MNGWQSPIITPREFVSPFVSPYSKEGGIGRAPVGPSAPSSGTFPSANRALYFPIIVPVQTTLSRFFWLNGATASTNNVQMGLYLDDGTAGAPGSSFLLGTSTLAAGASVCQFDNVTDTIVPPGRYWLALWCNGTTTTFLRNTGLGMRSTVMFDEDSLTGGLPATATPTQLGNVYFAVCGFTTVSSP